MPKVVAIIQARMGSKRLPGKTLIDINGKPCLEWVVNRVKAVNLLGKMFDKRKLIDNIVVATTTSTHDDSIVDWCRNQKVEVFRGDPIDVLKRYYLCAKKYKADKIIRITADCPLLEPLMVYYLLKKVVNYHALGTNLGKVPLGWDCEIFSFDELERAHKKLTGKKREHVTLSMRGEFQDHFDCGLEQWMFDTIKLDLDTKKDLRRIRAYAKLL